MIHTWLPEDWPEKAKEAAQRFRQGHLIEWDSVVFGAAFDHAICNVTRAVGDSGVGHVRVDDAVSHVLITSQTCDICEEEKKVLLMPWVSVVPVYDIAPFIEKGHAGNVRRNRVGYLIPLTHEGFMREGQLWVADLRFEYPLEKSVLVGKNPIEAFATQGDYMFLSDKLAYRRNRPAVDRRVRKYITVPLGQAFGKKAIDHGDVVEVRMVCGPSFEQVDRVEMHLLIDDAKDIERITRQYEAFEATLQLPADLKLLPPKVVPYDIYPYAISKGSAFVDYTDLSD